MVYFLQIIGAKITLFFHPDNQEPQALNIFLQSKDFFVFLGR